MQLSPSAGHPYQVLAEALIEKIKRGELSPDEKLPSQRELIKETGYQSATVQRAIALLVERGWVTTVPGRGSFVRERPTQEAEAPDLAAQMRDLREEVAALRSRVEAVEQGQQ
jgi:DNA-binding GntR family transcriptional regulator